MFDEVLKIGKEFRQFRKSVLRMPVHEVSNRSLICPTTIYNFERGDSDMMLKTFVHLVRSLGYTIELRPKDME